MTNCPKGSDWRKCDLHIHTPFSKNTNYQKEDDKETWQAFIKDLEANYENGSILGICDYNTFDGYFKLIEEYGDLQKKYKIFPVIELRTDDYVGKEPLQQLNLHIIFSDALDRNYLNDFLNATITKSKVKLKDIKDINTNPISIDKMETFFQDHQKYYKNKFLIMLGRNELGDMDPKIQPSYLDQVSFLCSASETMEQTITNQQKVKEFYKDKVKYLHCSDAHNYSSHTAERTRKIGHCYTWIKGKPIFETLRQAYYSYDTRVKFSVYKPMQAVNVLDQVTINLPDDARIGENECCYSGTKYELQLNPALNCFIGGRGTGKSLLLQLLCKDNQNLLPNENIVSKISPKDWSKYIDIAGIKFEYFSQGSIENFYKDKKNFAKSISDRLYQFWRTEEYPCDDADTTHIKFLDKIEDCKNILSKDLDSIREEINLIQLKITNDNEIAKKHQEVISLEKIVKAFNDEIYKQLSKNLAEKTNRTQFIQQSKEKLDKITNDISNIINENTEIIVQNEEESKLGYVLEYNRLISGLRELNKLSTNNMQSSEETAQEAYKEEQKIKQKLEEYFREKGLSKANIADSSNAQIKLNAISKEIERLEENNKKIEQCFTTLKSKTLASSTNYKNLMSDILQKTEQILKNKENSEVSSLSFEFHINSTDQFSNIIEFFKRNAGVYENDFKSLMNHIPEDKKTELLWADFLEEICKDYAPSLQSSKKILNFFEQNPRNKKLYDLHYLLHICDYITYETFNVLYKGKNLEDLSFGQRATAIVLTLLLFGNDPLIIDEPETHLDQRFIAKELVDIIKKVKMDKQIIFATHNANIVINSDAEQIFILKSLESSNKTDIHPMSIEDVYDNDKKEELMLLEGSAEAFRLREKKYVLES